MNSNQYRNRESFSGCGREPLPGLTPRLRIDATADADGLQGFRDRTKHTWTRLCEARGCTVGTKAMQHVLLTDGFAAQPYADHWPHTAEVDRRTQARAAWASSGGHLLRRLPLRLTDYTAATHGNALVSAARLFSLIAEAGVRLIEVRETRYARSPGPLHFQIPSC